MHTSEPAHTCHDCGIAGKPGERWVVSDTCDACLYRSETIRWRKDLPVPPHGNGPDYSREARP